MTYILTSVATARNAAALGVKAYSDPLVSVVAEGKQLTHTSSFMSSRVTDTLISAATNSYTDGLIRAVVSNDAPVGESFACK
jgi:hypothetical protein